MRKRISVAVAGLVTLATSFGMFGDDVGRLISHTPHEPINVRVPHEPINVRVPHEPINVRVPHEPINIPVVVKERTDYLSKENAEKVSKAACTLKDLDKFAYADSNDERWRIASEYLSDYLFEEDKLEVAVGLAQDMLGSEDFDAVEGYCDLIG